MLTGPQKTPRLARAATAKGAIVTGSRRRWHDCRLGDDGVHAYGSAENSGLLSATAKGAIASGSADGGTIGATDDGAYAEGSAENGGTINATGKGAHAEGTANFGTKLASGEGSHAEGNVGVTTTVLWGHILATTSGSHAHPANSSRSAQAAA